MKAMQHDPSGRQVFKVNFDQQNASTIVANCRDFERYIGPCEHRATGWGVILPANSSLVEQIFASGRVFRVEEPELAAFSIRSARQLLEALAAVGQDGQAQIVFRFASGQECFGHRVPTEDPRLMHFDQAHEDLENPGTSSITPIMRRNAKPWRRQDFMDKLHEEIEKREELLRAEGLL